MSALDGDALRYRREAPTAEQAEAIIKAAWDSASMQSHVRGYEKVRDGVRVDFTIVQFKGEPSENASDHSTYYRWPSVPSPSGSEQETA